MLTPGIGPGVVDRLEALGIDSLDKLNTLGVDEAIRRVCDAVGSTAWRNRRAALGEALQRMNVLSHPDPTRTGSGPCQRQEQPAPIRLTLAAFNPTSRFEWLTRLSATPPEVAQPDVGANRPQALDAEQLTFAVRAPFPNKSSITNLIYGSVSAKQPLKLRSRMPDNGVIFSDGMEADFLRFTAGIEATISVAARRGNLAV